MELRITFFSLARSSQVTHLVKMENLHIQRHIYIKQNDTIAEQREGLNMLLMLSKQTKADDEQPVITHDVFSRFSSNFRFRRNAAISVDGTSSG